LLEHFEEYLDWRLAGGHCPQCETEGTECARPRPRN
jgi:hypothetical protein